MNLMIGLSLVFFHFNGLPIQSLWYDSHAFAHGGTEWMLAEPSLRYYNQIANLMFLLVPAWSLLVPLVLFKRIPLDEMNVHLLVASGFMMLFVVSWRAQLGVYADWNLFAAAALPISFLVWRNVLRIQSVQAHSRVVLLLGTLFFIQSHAWVLSNHFE